MPQEWRSLLALPVDGLRRRIAERSEEMTRLRLSSPLPIVFDFTDEALRRRMWRLAKKPQELAMVEVYTDLMGTDELTVVEIARMLGRSEAWVEHMLKLGDLPSHQRADVEAFGEKRRKRNAALAEISESTELLEEITRAYDRGLASGLRKGRDQGRIFEMLLANEARVVDYARHYFGASCTVLLNDDGSLEIVNGLVDTATEERFVEALRDITGRRRVEMRGNDDPPPRSARMLSG